MTINNMIYNNKQRADMISGDTFVKLELCRVESVNFKENITLDVFTLETNKIIVGIEFSTPVAYLDRGILFTPEPGAIGLLGTTNKGKNVIISFITFSKSDELNEYLLPGEIMFQSKGYSFIKEDNAGNVIIGSSDGSFLVVGNKSTIHSLSTSETKITAAKEVFSGIDKGAVIEREKIYDKDVESDDSIEDIANNVMLGKEVKISNPSPVLIIEKGNVIDKDGNKEKLRINENPEKDAELCYKIIVADAVGNANASILVDKKGNIQIDGKRLILNFNQLDYSNCDVVTSNI